ncbi:hypothetical protein DL766_001016 [Monosporascus sp. MC13-8B]|uniref:Cell surface protein n=1 Tax=Monosporascus cannonballus TaxID=155416 RepID=A0ABY0HB95_9PEZI|nr:hypothetical protein DL763_010660 [Monosporascus cannonballus]RYO86359.1 hypothetical protein DL762_004775 [Monosporascus cannonballus]RYP38307.1 hypothetical protein DL766_001016 [Monosporascus sp. MC13-8B]
MRYSLLVAASGLLISVSSHGVVTSIQGANGVEMPGLTIADGTPRDCSSNRCGSQADTAIIRDREIARGEVGPLGRTQGNGPVNAETMIRTFMSGAAAPQNNGPADSVGVEDNIDQEGLRGGRGNKRGIFGRQFGGFLSGLFGGRGGEKTETAEETIVAASAGQGATAGLPTCADDGSITMTFRQINQDGAGPMEAAVDGTSGGTDPDAFTTAEVTQDVPGLGFQGLSLATNTDFPLTVQMPAGMTCEGTVGGVNNVCIVRVRNGAAAGPFGGSAAFTQSPAARKRAIEYRLKKRSLESHRRRR